MVSVLTLVVLTFFGVAYPWILPVLAEIGFAKKGAESISGFIETPAATGGMAVATAGPIWLMYILEQKLTDQNEKRLEWSHRLLRKFSFYVFLIGYGGFLIFNKTDYKNAHYAFVFLFSVFFFIHAVYRYCDIQSLPAQIVLLLGISAFCTMAGMIIIDFGSLWFWATECIGFSMLLLFTPIELYTLREGYQTSEIDFFVM